MTEQKWPQKIILIRHGKTVRNVMKEQAKTQGNREVWADGLRDQDTALTETGISQSLAVGLHLAKTETELRAVFVSPYRRTRQTAEHILTAFSSLAAPTDVPPKLVVEERIREIEFGVLDGLTPHGIQTKYPDELVRREREGKYWYRPPGGESRPDVALRVHSFLAGC